MKWVKNNSKDGSEQIVLKKGSNAQRHSIAIWNEKNKTLSMHLYSSFNEPINREATIKLQRTRAKRMLSGKRHIYIEPEIKFASRKHRGTFLKTEIYIIQNERPSIEKLNAYLRLSEAYVPAI